MELCCALCTAVVCLDIFGHLSTEVSRSALSSVFIWHLKEVDKGGKCLTLLAHALKSLKTLEDYGVGLKGVLGCVVSYKIDFPRSIYGKW